MTTNTTRRATVRALGLAASGAALPGLAGLSGCATPAGPAWITLIDGDKGLENFERVGDANWRAENGAIVADRAATVGFLVTRTAYADCEIRAEFWAEAQTNSGIFVRCQNTAAITASNAYEVNIWDTRPDPRFGTGAIVDVQSVPVPIVNRAGGRWNTMEVTLRGPEITVRLNGVLTAMARDSTHARGPFALQFANLANNAPGAPIRWRSVKVRAA